MYLLFAIILVVIRLRYIKNKVEPEEELIEKEDMRIWKTLTFIELFLVGIVFFSLHSPKEFPAIRIPPVITEPETNNYLGEQMFTGLEPIGIVIYFTTEEEKNPGTRPPLNCTSDSIGTEHRTLNDPEYLASSQWECGEEITLCTLLRCLTFIKYDSCSQCAGETIRISQWGIEQLCGQEQNCKVYPK